MATAEVEWFRDQYCRSPADGHNPFAAPLRRDDGWLADLPPAVVATAGTDPLRDEGRAHAGRLSAAGVPVTRVPESDHCHGGCSLTDEAPLADDAMTELCAWLPERLSGR